MLLLFLACAMFPLVSLTIVILRETSGEMDRQQRTNLRRTAKAVGMSIIAKFTETTNFARILAHAAATSAESFHTEMKTSAASRLSAAVVLGEAGDTVALSHGEHFAALQRPIQTYADARLLFGMRNGSEPWLATTSVHDVNGRRVRVVTLSEPTAFFGQTEIQGWLDGAMESCVMLDGSALWCSIDRSQWTRVREKKDQALVGGNAYPAMTWSGFATLTSASPLSVLVFDDAVVSLGSDSLFRSLVLLALISIVIVFLLSHVQLRRSLRPLEQLTDATRRMGADNLGARVDVRLNDEFGTLARAFNDMSGRLASQVTLLSSTAAVNDEALRANSLPELLPRLTTHIRSLLPPHFGLSVAVRLDNTRWMRVSTMTRSSDWVDDEMELGQGGLHALIEKDLVSGRFGLRASHAYMRAPRGQSGWECPAVALPLRDERELVGMIIVLVPEGTLAMNAELHNVRAMASDLVLAINRTRLLGRLEQFNYGTLTALARTVDANSPWTAGHSENVTRGAMLLGEALHLTRDEIDLLHRGGLLHDIGKIAVPAAILDKPGRLTPEERAVVESHPEVGARILAPIAAYETIVPIVLYHHERFDGNGYPHKLRGEAIPLLARIVTVVDVYDALISDRPYREGWEAERAAAFIQENAGTHFDPALAQAFTSVEPQLRLWYAERRQQENQRRGLSQIPEMSAA
ncbi:MAG: HD domain-containing phosphohydrolase [Gemmatimonadota bacterium]